MMSWIFKITVWEGGTPLLEVEVIKGILRKTRVIKHFEQFAEGEKKWGNFAEGEKILGDFYCIGRGGYPPFGKWRN